MKAMGISRNSHRFLTSHKAFGFVGVFAWKDGARGFCLCQMEKLRRRSSGVSFLPAEGERLSAQGFVKVLSK